MGGKEAERGYKGQVFSGEKLDPLESCLMESCPPVLRGVGPDAQMCYRSVLNLE